MYTNYDEITTYLLNNKAKIENGELKKVEICIHLGVCERTVYRYLQILKIKTAARVRYEKKTNFKRIIQLEKIVKTLARVLYEVQEDIGSKPHPSVIEILKGKR